MRLRVERDYLGELSIPDKSLYGIQTFRAVQNFPVTGLKLDRDLIMALGIVKGAAAQANLIQGSLDPKIAEAVIEAAAEIAGGKLLEHFPVDPIQGGAGTSMNMNINEVIANRAIEILGGKRGYYHLVSPNSHVNMSQSTNDVIPTAARIAALKKTGMLLETVDHTIAVLQQKEREFDDCVKIGRTHLQDAVPIRLGQEFGAYAAAVTRARENIVTACSGLEEINIGATAVGTGLNADPGYVRTTVRILRELSGLNLRLAGNLVDATQNEDTYVVVSASLKQLAVVLSKMANDLRLMASGPRCGLHEIYLPEVQPGSSIMPGKVNPVLPETVNQVAFQVIGNDATICMAAEAGQFELNVMVPVIYFNLFQSYEIMTNVLRPFIDHCLNGIKPNRERCRDYAEKNAGVATALNPYIGYEKACRVAREAMETGRTVREIAMADNLFHPKKLDQILDPVKMTMPGIAGREPQ